LFGVVFAQANSLGEEMQHRQAACHSHRSEPQASSFWGTVSMDFVAPRADARAALVGNPGDFLA